MVIVLEKQTVKPLSQAFSIDLFYIDEKSVLDAVERKSMFNLIDGSSGNKVSFWLLTNKPFDKSRFTRRQRVEALGITNFYTTTPEEYDTQQITLGEAGSERQLTDAIRVFEMQFDRLDIEYLKHWITTLELDIQWQHLVDQAEPY